MTAARLAAFALSAALLCGHSYGVDAGKHEVWSLLSRPIDAEAHADGDCWAEDTEQTYMLQTQKWSTLSQTDARSDAALPGPSQLKTIDSTWLRQLLGFGLLVLGGGVFGTMRKGGSLGLEPASPDGAAHAGLTWQDVSWLMLSDIVGTSVLTFSGVSKQLGWVPTVFFIVGLFPVSLYVSVLMARTRTLVLKTAALCKVEGSEVCVGTMGEVAGLAFQRPGAGSVVEVVVYVYTFFGQASYLLVLGNAVQQIWYTHPLCLYAAVAIGCLALAGPLLIMRRLRDSVLVCLVNTLLIAAVVVLALFRIAEDSPRETRGMRAVNPDLDFSGAFGAATNVVYSYAGQWMYFELMDTMATPSDFPRAFFVAGPFMVGMYLVVALVSLHLGTQHGDLMADVPQGGMLSAIAVLLFLHVAIVYLIKGVVIARFLLKRCSPNDLDTITLASYLKHGGFTMGMLFAGWLLANAVPFFSPFLGLIGGLLAGPINFLLPIILFLAARSHSLQGELSVSARSQLEPSSSPSTPSGALSAQGLLSTALRGLPVWELAMMVLVVVFVGCTMLFGVYSQILNIMILQDEFGAPFTCHALQAPLLHAGSAKGR